MRSSTFPKVREDGMRASRFASSSEIFTLIALEIVRRRRFAERPARS